MLKISGFIYYREMNNQQDVEIPLINNPIKKRFQSVIKNSFWQSIDDEHWSRWAWQQQNRVRTIAQLQNIINVAPHELSGFEETKNLFNMGISPYYASLMDVNNPLCPIRMQAVPCISELFISPEDLSDPLNEEEDMPVPGITHRYPDRVLLYTIHNCAVYCRFCTRKRKVATPSSASSKMILEGAFNYIEQHKSIRDVVISGGDPLYLFK